MLSIIVAFPNIENAKKIKSILVKNGYDVTTTCTSASQVIGYANELDQGIVICGWRFSDMHYSKLHMYLPNGFQMLLMAPAAKLEDYTNKDIVCLKMPAKIQDLLNTLEMMTYNYMHRKKKNKEKPKARSEEEKETISKAKALLMNRNNMSEEEAHRYIQKMSMDRGTNIVETASGILNTM